MPHPDDFDSFDAALRDAAHAYHAPPPAPVDAMWAAIEARRNGVHHARARTDMAEGGPDLVVHRADVRQASGWSRAARRWTPLAAAAVVLLAVGVGVGRYSAAPHRLPVAPGIVASHAPSGDAGAAVATPEAATPANPRSGDAGAPNDPRAHAAGAPSRVARGAPTASERLLGTPRRIAPPSVDGGALAALPDAHEVASVPLRAAADQHLADAEALLTAFDAGAAPGHDRAAAPDSAWARDLLTTTRLLLDSPAGRDPARRTLLETLELVLVQIARLPHADTPPERALIERAIRNGDLMARLRAAVPSGSGRSRAVQGT